MDAFSDDIENEGQDLCVPACLFFGECGLFDLLRRYKFTVEENTPLDQEVALDPELLGQVFENLLAAYNKETRETARKATGSYYTAAPRGGLHGRRGAGGGSGGENRPSQRRRHGTRTASPPLDHERAFEDGQDPFSPEEKKAVVRAIAELRVLDPAVGSGAFPMGVLRKLTLALRRLDPGNKYWEDLQRERAQKRASAAISIEDKKEREKELLEISRTFDAHRDF